MELPQGDVVDERDVVTGMPVVGVHHNVELDGFKELVDGHNDVFTVVFSRAVSDVQAAADEVVLDVDDESRRDGFDDLGVA